MTAIEQIIIKYETYIPSKHYAKFPDELREDVMLGYLCGLSVTALARKYNLLQGTVSNWINSAIDKATLIYMSKGE